MVFGLNRCFLLAGVASLFLTSQLFSNPTEAEIEDYFTTHYPIDVLDEGTKAKLLMLSDQAWLNLKEVFSKDFQGQISRQCRTSVIRFVSQVPVEKHERVYESLKKLLMATRETLQINEPRGLTVFIQQIAAFENTEDPDIFTKFLVEIIMKSSPKQDDNHFILQVYDAWCQVVEAPEDEKMGIFECTREDLDVVIQDESDLGLISKDHWRARASMLNAVFEANEQIQFKQTQTQAVKAAPKRGRSPNAAEHENND